MLSHRTPLCRAVLLNSMFKHTEPMSEHVRTALLVAAHVAVTQRHLRTLSDKTLKVRRIE